MTNTILHFATKRGGRFNNEAILSFRGERNISEAITMRDGGKYCWFMNEDETMYIDSNGDKLIITDELNSGVGKVEWDTYESDYCKNLADISDDEILAIKAAGWYDSSNLLACL